ncbi:hypothetical protein BDD12DRAFT_865001 [Trichophaea hybrida]|nr:hypothetical protein BDD12DRAFT_865001 [Trichophaea hybrida]
MSLSIFKSALGRALCRRPLSIYALACFNGTVLDAVIPHCRHQRASVRARPISDAAICRDEPEEPSKALWKPPKTILWKPPRTMPWNPPQAATQRWRLQMARRSPRMSRRLRSRKPIGYAVFPWPSRLRRCRNRSTLFRRLLDEASRSQRASGGTEQGDLPLNTRWFYDTPVPELTTLLRDTCVGIKVFSPGKTDLSYINPLTPVSQRKRRRKPMVAPLCRRTRFSLKEITASFIHHCNLIGGFQGGSSGSTLPSRARRRENRKERRKKDLMVMWEVFRPWVRSYLQWRGCTPEDVMTWSWILTTEDENMVGLKLKAILEKFRVDGSLKKGYPRPLPPFVILAILQRKHLRQSTLRIISPIIKDLYSPHHPLRIRDDKTTILLSIRLLRHLRETWPTALPRVVDFINNNFYATARSRSPPAWVTHAFNRFLLLFSLPTSDGPYRNVPLLQKCQFALVQRMATLGAPITREGYRAIITVQLAHHKTFGEAQRVRNMGKNWPPWLTERDGWSATHRRAHEEVVSRGGQVIRQMMEAGYSLMDWEKEALVLAGKDTDSSPTIQTRSFWNKQKLGEGYVGGDSSRIWAARVRATRTLEEAWWNFQECKAQRGVPHTDVWKEMFEKVIWEKKLKKKMNDESVARKAVSGNPYLTRSDFWLRNLDEQKNNTVPGDGKELIPPPLNPRDGVFNADPPPNVEDLFGMMIRNGVRPKARLAALIIAEAKKSIPFAMTVIKHWDPEQTHHFLSPLHNFSSKQAKPSPSPTKPLNNKVLTAFLLRLCNSRSPFKALRLIHHHRPKYRPAWNGVIQGFVHFLNPRSSLQSTLQPHHRIESLRAIWQLYKDMTRLVDIDNETLRLLAVAMERWIIIPLPETVLWSGKPPSEKIIPIFFENIGINNNDEEPMLPPEPVVLHAFVRALGFARKYAEMELLIRFLAGKEVKLEDTMGRRVLVAAKAFLEGAGYGVPEGNAEISKMGWMVLERLDPVVREAWGGWGEESDVEAYLILAGMVRGRRVNDVVAL